MSHTQIDKENYISLSLMHVFDPVKTGLHRAIIIEWAQTNYSHLNSKQNKNKLGPFPHKWLLKKQTKKIINVSTSWEFYRPNNFTHC